VFVMRPPGTEFPVGLQALVDDLPEGLIMAEVGSYAGESTAVFARKVLKIYAVDPWVNYVENNPTQQVVMNDLAEAEAAFDMMARGFTNIVKLKKYSHEAVSVFQDGSLDLVYIDGNHEYKHVCEDIRLWLPKIKRGGIISGHDYYYVDNIYRDVKRAVQDSIGMPDKVYADYSWVKRVPIRE